ncbi:hypothetical protein GALL_419810 [mine drainage metagenome]|uniref:Uncharacterized protein n=1 Tax=mine drainage metagenome TaxID=410659 RepID=A0A1J5PZD6_9ZZZZ
MDCGGAIGKSLLKHWRHILTQHQEEKSEGDCANDHLRYCGNERVVPALRRKKYVRHDLENEGKHETEERKRFSESKPKECDRLEYATRFWLTSYAVDVSGEDQTSCDCRPDGRKAISDEVEGALHFSSLPFRLLPKRLLEQVRQLVMG